MISVNLYLSFFSSFYIWLYRAWLSRDLLSCLCFVLTDYWRGSRHYGWTSIHLFSRKDEKWTMFATYRFWECLSISNHNRQSKVSIGRICDINEFDLKSSNTKIYRLRTPLHFFKISGGKDSIMELGQTFDSCFLDTDIYFDNFSSNRFKICILHWTTFGN